MVRRPLHCDPNRLRQFLDDHLEEPERSGVVDHLDNCESCRQHLDEITSGDPAWEELRRFAPARTGPIPPRGGAEGGAIADEAVEVPDVLEPSGDPGALGRIGPYEILEVIGRGGMGVVLKAFDSSLHRVVAIKLMAPELAAGAGARQRFTREARAAASLAHDHVVTIHAVDEAKCLPYLVMSYVAGRSLQERIHATGPLAPREIVRIGMQIASGLAAAHAQGLVHRDIKPANILLENGVERVKITDFGLARSAEDATLTQSGVLFGTPEYMAPERANGEPVDGRADLFSLGCVLYAMSTGHSPFRAKTSLDVLRRVCDDQPRPIRDLNPEIPDWLEAIVSKLLEKAPASRFQTAEEVDSLLERCLGHLQQPGSIPLPQVPRDGRGGRGRKPRRLAGLALAMAGALALGAVVVLRLSTTQGTLVVVVDDPEVRVAVDGQELVITGAGPQEIRLATGWHRVKAAGHRETLLDQVVTVEKNGKTVVRVRREGPGPRTASATPGGRVDELPIAPPPAISVDPGRAAATPLMPGSPLPGPSATSAARDSTLPKTPVPLRNFEGHTGAVRGVAFLPGSPGAISAGREGTLRLWDLRSGWELYQFGAEGHRPNALALLPGGGTAVTAGEGGEVIVWNVRAISDERRLKGHEGPVHAVAACLDGRQVISGGSDGTARCWDVASGKEVRVFKGHEGPVRSVSVTPDGRRVLTAGDDGTVRLWDLSAGELIRIYRGHKGSVRGVAASPNDRHFVSGGDDREVQVGDLQTGATLARLKGHTGAVVAVSIAPDWRHALSLGRDATLRVWDLVALKERGRAEVAGKPTILAIAKGSRLALTGGGDSVARLWLIPLAPGESGDPAPAEVVPTGTATESSTRRPLEFLAPLKGLRR